MKLAVPDEAAMVVLGGRLALACHDAMVFYLEGPLGAGKTTLVRGFMRGMRYDAAVKSPTYTLIEPYQAGDRHLFHLDLYRVHDPGELEYLGLRELQDGDAVILVEWPERGAGFLPPADVVLNIDYAAQGRHVVLEARTTAGERFIKVVAGSDFSEG